MCRKWKNINIYENLPYKYSISDDGKVLNEDRKVLVRPVIKKSGNAEVQLSRTCKCNVEDLVEILFNGKNIENKLKEKIKQKVSAEKTIENKIKEYLFKKGHLYFKVHGSSFMEPGISDIIACICGRFVAIEVKATGKKSNESAQQKIFGNNVIKSNGLYYLVDSLEEVVEIVEGIEAYEHKSIEENI